MIDCIFEDGKKARIGLRHVTVGAIAFNDKKEVLLVKRSAKVTGSGKYAVPGGFLDRNESTKVAVLRELKEETGYEGEVIELFQINDNPNRPKEDRQNVDFIFLVKVSGGKYVDNDETISIAWFSEKNLPSEEDFAFDHRNIVLKYFNFLKNPFTLPILGKV